MKIVALIPALEARRRDNVLDRDFNRFVSSIEKIEDNGCWRWGKHIGRWGYGQFYYNGKLGYVHVFAHLAFVGDIPENHKVDHVAERGCLYRDCVNPDHLEAVTHAENIFRSPTAVTSIAKSKTHCPKGHPYSGENLWVEPSTGTRRCRKCTNEKNNKAYHRRKNNS